MSYIVVSPAYGRDYKSAKEAKAAWLEGKDFVHESAMFTGGGTYVSVRDVPNTTVEIRYKRMTQVCVVKGGK